MVIEALEGRSFGERRYRLCAEKAAEFVSVTGDDPERWSRVAPPGLAAALLFVVAPDLLNDPLVDGPVVHGDQAFHWHRPLTLETDVAVRGIVERVRRRGETAYLTFMLDVTSDSTTVLEGRSTFLIGDLSVDSDGTVEVPGPHERGPTRSVGSELPTPRSASRTDLVRYAAATRDWNPIHWDHASAVAAGLGGVVVHGLLQSAWLTQIACSGRSDLDRPLATARFRYRSPMRPAQAAMVDGKVGEDTADLELSVGDQVIVSGHFELAS